MPSLTLIEPFFTGSHQRWAEEVRQFLHGWDVRIIHLPGVHWKWRMHGGAASLYDLWRRDGGQTDLLLCTDLMDVAFFRALMARDGIHIPVATYFHENQLSYPWSPDDPDPALQRDRHYGFINISTALSSDAVIFNSEYHRQSFLRAVGTYLKDLPDHRMPHAAEEIQKRSAVIHPGIDTHFLEKCRVARSTDGPPIILWNHRWEFDKNPEAFFRALYRESERGTPFQLVVLGESFPKSPPVFREARERLSAHILHWGFCDSREEYARWLWRSHLLPVTAIQDFFGYSVVEALACGVIPLLPDRLAYPEHVRNAAFFYPEKSFEERLHELLTSPGTPVPDCADYSWSRQAPLLDQTLRSLI